jgi:hypothetical protein
MGYSMQNGRFANTLDVTFVNGATTATASSTAIELGDRGVVRVDVTVSVATGTTPSNTISLDTSKDGVTAWSTIASFTAITAAGTARKVFSGCDRFVRITETITGTTPSFTRVITGEAV